MRIAYLSQQRNIIGGGERSLLEILEFLPSEVEPLLVLPGAGDMQKLARVLGVRTEILPMPPVGLSSLSALGRWRAFWRRERFDLVHANHARAALYAMLSGAPPVIFHARVAARDRLDGFLLRRAAAIVCNSEATARARFPEGHPKVHVIYNGVPVPRVAAAVARGERLVWLGRWDAIKRPELAVDVLEALAPDWAGELVIAGGALPGDATNERLRARVAASPLADRIQLRLPTRKAGELLASARFCLVTSRHEGFGRVAVEAMALGTPVAALAVGSLPEVVGKGGVLAGDARELAARMSPYLRDAQAWNALSEQARAQAARFAPEAMAARLAALYRELTG